MGRPGGERDALQPRVVPGQRAQQRPVERVPHPSRPVSEAVARSDPSGENATAVTSPLCPRRVARAEPVAVSQVRAVWSADPVAISAPDGE